MYYQKCFRCSDLHIDNNVLNHFMDGKLRTVIASRILGSKDNKSLVFSSPEPKGQGELIVWDSSRRPSVCDICPSVHTFKYEYLDLRRTGRPTGCMIKIKFHLEHHWGGGRAALNFGL